MNEKHVKDSEQSKIYKIANSRSMKSVIMENKEIIVYGAGNMARTVIKEIVECGLENYIVCCAITESFGNPKEIMGIPVLEVKWMPHFRETACFIIAVREEYQAEIYEYLLQFGCKNIVVIDYKYELNLERKQAGVQEDTQSVKDLKKEIQYLTAKIDEIQYYIAEQNEVCAVNTETFKSFENCNHGKDIVITATGPTLSYYYPIKDAIHIGMNTAWRRKDISYDYYFIQDGNRRGDWKKFLESAIENVNCTIFMGKYLKRSIWNGNEFPVQCRDGKQIKRYFVHPSLVEDIYQNICFHPLMDFYSVVFPALHFALYTLPRRIYLVGCDILGKERFFEHNWKYGYAKVKEFAEQYYPDTQIISVNPKSLKGLFIDEYTDNFLKDKEEKNEC